MSTEADSITFVSELLPSVQPEILYHYTSPTGLLGMLTHREIWASDCSFLNDTAELVYADRIVKEVISELKDSKTVNTANIDKLDAIQNLIDSDLAISALSTSFSENGDLLSQWRAYCPISGGYSVGFRLKIRGQLGAPFSFTLLPCIYDPSRQKKIVENLLRMVTISRASPDESQSSFELFYRFVRPAIKHPSFSEEKEWRLLSVDPLETIHEMKYRPGTPFMIPYHPISFPKESVKEIIVGPCGHISIAAKSVRQMISSHGFSDITVKVSEVTLRPR
jgi:Protein of unknown function (DUF2971)